MWLLENLGAHFVRKGKAESAKNPSAGYPTNARAGKQLRRFIYGSFLHLAPKCPRRQHFENAASASNVKAPGVESASCLKSNAVSPTAHLASTPPLMAIGSGAAAAAAVTGRRYAHRQ